MDKLEFKKTLEEAVEILTNVKRLEKTPSVNFIASSLRVKPRQVFRWLGNDAHAPHDLENKSKALTELIAQCKNGDFISSPKSSATIPVTMIISKDSIKISQDKDGNIILNGLLSLKL